jgi:CHAD domain-containing protein
MRHLRDLEFTSHIPLGAQPELVGLWDKPLSISRNTPPAAFGPKSRRIDVFASLLAASANQITSGRRIILGSDDPKGPHQIRIGLRRLRSVLKALRPLVGLSAVQAIETRARDVARWIGELRDLDALMNAICMPLSEMVPDRQGFARLQKTLIEHREAKQAEIRTLLEGVVWGKLQTDLDLLSRVLESIEAPDRSILGYAREVLNKRWRKLFKLGCRLDELSIEARHEMRKLLKQLRYLSEFFAPVFVKTKKASQFIAEIKQLQDVFGYLNDVELARRLLGPETPLAGKSEHAAAAYFILGWHEAEAQHVWTGANEAWDRLQHAPKFWK